MEKFVGPRVGTADLARPVERVREDVRERFARATRGGPDDGAPGRTPVPVVRALGARRRFIVAGVVAPCRPRCELLGRADAASARNLGEVQREEPAVVALQEVREVVAQVVEKRPRLARGLVCDGNRIAERVEHADVADGTDVVESGDQ